MDPIYHFAPNPFPADLRKELPYPSAPWLVSQELFKRLAAAPAVNKPYKKIELRPDDPEAMFVQKYYEHNPPHGKSIRRIYVIHSDYQSQRFEAELRKCEQEAIKYKPNWSMEGEAEHRNDVYVHWQQIADQFTPLEITSSKRIDRIIHARVLPLWRGTSQQIAESICGSGFTFFDKNHLFDSNNQQEEIDGTNVGYFGNGIYFTDNSSYAAKYSKEDILMLAFVAMRTPFPIVGDIPHPAQGSDMRRFMGKELYQEYNAHFAPVAPIAPGSLQYYPCHFEQSDCNEYVIKTPSQTLARYQIEIGNEFPLFQAIITQGKNNLPLSKKSDAHQITSEILVHNLRTHYTAICTDMPLLMGDTTFPLKKFFTQLFIFDSKIVENKEKEEIQKQEMENPYRDIRLFGQDSLAEAIAHLQETMIPIPMEELFANKESAKEPKKVLLIGRAGIGKTTLMDRMTLGWAEGEMFTQFDAVFRLVLRELNDFEKASHNFQWLAAAISHAIYKDEDRFQEMLAFIRQKQNRILILFDGLDEAKPELIRKIESLLQIPELYILISSRPGVPLAIIKRTDRQVENTGFSRPQIEEYIAKFFARETDDANQTKLFLEAISKNHNLFSLAYTPLQLQILCTLWEQGAKANGFDSSLTAHYTKMFEQLFLWQVRKQNPYANIGDFSIDKRLLEGLGKIAIAGLEARQLTLSEPTVNQALQESGVTIAELRATGFLKRSGKDYTFFHLTFQKHLIAYYVSLLSSKEQWDFIRTNRYKPHYRLIMIFLAGHIYQSDDTQDKAKTKHFFAALFSAGADLAGYMQLEITLRCASECPLLYDWVNDTFGIEEALRKLLAVYVDQQNANDSEKILGKLSQLCRLRKIDPHNDWLTNDLKKMCDRQQPRLLKRILNTFIEQPLLTAENSLEQRFINSILKLHSIINIDDEILNKIVDLLTDYDNSYSVQDRAAEALISIGANEKFREAIISKIVVVLPKCRGDVAIKVIKSIQSSGNFDEMISSKLVEDLAHIQIGQFSLIMALPRIIASLKLNEAIIPKIVKLLANSEWHIRSGSAQVLGNIPELDEESIYKIAELLADHDWYVRYAATEALGKIGARGRKLDEAIISKIADLLADSESEMRRAAAEALGQIEASEKLNKTVFFKIFELLGDSNHYVRVAALKALKNIGANVKLDETIISKIAEFLTHSDSKVRFVATEMLGKIGNSVQLDEEIFSKIVNLLADSNSEVRSAATSALGIIGANVKLDETIIYKIVELLTDYYGEVRSAAKIALKNIGANVKLDETIISKIAELLTHSDSDVRSVATETLGKIGNRLQLDEKILSKIVNLLADSDWVVRSEARTALGIIGAHRMLDGAIISKIAALLADRDLYVRVLALQALGNIGTNMKLDETIISKIVHCFVFSDDSTIAAASEALKEIRECGQLDEAIISEIVNLLNHHYWKIVEVRNVGYFNVKNIQDLLTEIGKRKHDEAIISKIVNLIAHREPGVRKIAADALGNIGADQNLDETIIFEIFKLLTNGHSEVRVAAAKALVKIEASGKLDEAIISKIVNLLTCHPLGAGNIAAEAFGNVGGVFWRLNAETVSIISKLVELLDDRDSNVQVGAAEALGKIGANIELDKTIISKLVELLDNSDSNVQVGAAEALVKIGANMKLDKTIISKIAEILVHSNNEVLSVLVKAIGNINTNVKLNETIISRIVELLFLDVRDLSFYEKRALENIETNVKLDEKTISNIFRFLSHNHLKNARNPAAKMLERLGKHDERIISIIADILALEKNWSRQKVAVEVLGKIGASVKLDERIISIIADLLTHEYYEERNAAIKALGKIGTRVKLDETIISKIIELSVAEWSFDSINQFWNSKLTAKKALERISLQNFVKNPQVFLFDQAFLRQAVIHLEKVNQTVFLVILEKENETRIPLSNPQVFIQIANRNSFVGPFVNRYSKKNPFEPHTFFKDEEQKKENCIIQ